MPSFTDQLGRTVWVSDIRTLSEALDMIGSMGELTGKDPEARNLTKEIARRFDDLHLLRSDDPPRRPDVPNASAAPAHHPRTAYFIWRNPWMVAGGDTFIHDMLLRCGLDNLFGDRLRYPSIDLASLAEMQCERVLLSSEPYPFAEKHILEIQSVVPHAKIQLVDGEMFAWYGSRLLNAPLYFRQLAAKGNT
jgi:ABC-type Fe3+-hydroxamate transport system substrate-binding protein